MKNGFAHYCSNKSGVFSKLKSKDAGIGFYLGGKWGWGIHSGSKTIIITDHNQINSKTQFERKGKTLVKIFTIK